MARGDFYSITFDDKNTWDDWGLIALDKRHLIVPPPVRRDSQVIAGRHGELDFSRALTGEPVFDNRKDELRFRFYGHAQRSTRARLSEILTYLHGQERKMILSDEPGWYYIGTFEAEEPKFRHRWKDWADVVIKYNLDPFKYATTLSDDPMLWDDVNFETTIFREYDKIAFTTSKSMTVDFGTQPVIATVTISDLQGASGTLTVDGTTYTFTALNNVITLPKLSGEHTLAFAATSGKITISFREKSL